MGAQGLARGHDQTPTTTMPLVALCLAALFGACGGAELSKAEREKIRCARLPEHLPVRQPGDLNATFEQFLNGAFAEYGPVVKSVDPWVVYFENFLSEEEVQAGEAHMFTQKFHKSAAGGEGIHEARNSETAFCIGKCDEHPALQTIQKRASLITKVPQENFDFTQALKYREGMFYRAHHDNHPTFKYLPCGARIYTWFVYLSDEGLVGGATAFPRLNISVPAKRGAAVLFVDTKDDEPMETDERTEHESVTVTQGEKRGLNLWLYQHNYRAYWDQACTSIELADTLGRHEAGLPPEPEDPQPKVTFKNRYKKEVHIFWWDEEEDQEHPMGVVPSAGTLGLTTTPGHVFRARDKPEGGKLLYEYQVRYRRKQVVWLPEKEKKRDEEL